VNVPPPPPVTSPEPAPPASEEPTPSQPEPGATAPQPSAPEAEVDPNDPNLLDIPADTVPLMVETGTASWYGAPYHNRRGSNGEIYNMHASTAAHRTLPLGSIVRVTNLKTGASTLVRITDRGPFVDGRVIDLSLAAAKKIDVWRAGLAQVKLEVLRTPAPIDIGGRWAVQIGSFSDEDSAAKLQDRLQRRYHTAKVLKFGSPVGDWWVRVRVLDDARSRAEAVVRDTQTDEGSIFLVRLD
jgi:rare lipoprotein A